MAWFRNRIFVQKSIKSPVSTEEECDPQACYDSFKGHWQQAELIIKRVQQLPKHDHVLEVVNHLEQMGTLLQYDIKKNSNRFSNSHSSECLEYLLEDRVLEQLFDWSTKSGVYTNAVMSEQFKLYDILVSQTREVLFTHEPFIKPFIQLLCSCNGQFFNKDIEKQLVDILNQVSALLLQNIEFIDKFFIEDKGIPRFLIFGLLIPFVHRDDQIGHRARDALLLCMSLSKKNKKVATYIAENSNFSILVASGLSGLYSALPNVLDDIHVPDWHRFTPDDVTEIKGLLTFVTSLEFSNAVAQVAHPVIRKQLQEFLYRGFLIPVLGPALLQNTSEEQVAATAYLELIIRTATEPGLLHALLEFLLKMDYDGQKLLNILIERIQGERQLCLVSLAVFESMLDLNCEDLMLELVFKHLQPCLHLMLSQRRVLLPLDPFCQSFEKLLVLAPNCCAVLDHQPENEESKPKYKQSLFGKYYAYLTDARNKIEQCQTACKVWANSYSGAEERVSESEENLNSITSIERSSGYESFTANMEDKEEDFWTVSSSRTSKNVSALVVDDTKLESSGNPGPFLLILMKQLANFLSNSFYINLHLTGLISRLAAYPQPLLRAYLLDQSLVLQPNVPSLFEIIATIKESIDTYMSRRSDAENLIKYAKDYLIEREIMLVNLRRYNSEQPVARSESFSEPFQRNGSKRRSFNIASSWSSVFRRPSQLDGSVPMVPTLPHQNGQFVIYQKFNDGQHVALCAVLLDEWVKELAALAQEHTLAQIATLLK